MQNQTQTNIQAAQDANKDKGADDRSRNTSAAKDSGEVVDNNLGAAGLGTLGEVDIEDKESTKSKEGPGPSTESPRGSEIHGARGGDRPAQKHTSQKS